MLLSEDLSVRHRGSWGILFVATVTFVLVLATDCHPEEVSLYANGNLLRFDVPDGFVSLSQTNHAKYIEWSDTIHDADVRKTLDVFVPPPIDEDIALGRVIEIQMYRDWRGLPVYEQAWAERVNDLIPVIDQDNRMHRLESLENLRKFSASRLDLLWEDGPTSSTLQFVDNSFAIGWSSGWKLGPNTSTSETNGGYITLVVAYVVNGIPIHFRIQSGLVGQQNFESETAWLLSTANRLVATADELNPDRFGDYDRIDARIREGRRKMFRGLGSLALIAIVSVISTIWRKRRGSASPPDATTEQDA